MMMMMMMMMMTVEISEKPTLSFVVSVTAANKLQKNNWDQTDAKGDHEINCKLNIQVR